MDAKINLYTIFFLKLSALAGGEAQTQETDTMDSEDDKIIMLSSSIII